LSLIYSHVLALHDALPILFLEGTGAMVLDHVDRVAYVVRSNRADPVLLERFCTHFNYEPMVFDAVDRQGRAIYHTNVLMCIATEDRKSTRLNSSHVKISYA